MILALIIGAVAVASYQTGRWIKLSDIRRADEDDWRLVDPKDVHAAMMNAPHDGKDFRQARAALEFLKRQCLP